MPKKRVRPEDLEKFINAAIASGASVKVRVQNDKHGHYRYLNSCRGKVKYGRQETALRAVIDMAEKGAGGLEAYECEFCKKWHIGHDRSSTVGKFEKIIAAAKEKLKNL